MKLLADDFANCVFLSSLPLQFLEFLIDFFVSFVSRESQIRFSVQVSKPTGGLNSKEFQQIILMNYDGPTAFKVMRSAPEWKMR